MMWHPVKFSKGLHNYAYTYVHIQDIEKGLQALWGYSTHLNEHETSSQHMYRNQCLLRYGRAFKKIAHWEEWKKLPEAVCEELHLLKVSVFPLFGTLSMNNHFTHTTSSECKPSLLLTIVQGWCFCQWFLSKCVVNVQFVANILFTAEARFASDCIVNFRNTDIWVDDNAHTTVASRHHHRFSINVSVGILCDQRLGPVVLTNRLTSAMYHRFSVNDFQYSLNMCFFMNNTRGSCMKSHRLIFSSLSDSAWIRLSLKSG
jgi:hypothetical protein